MSANVVWHSYPVDQKIRAQQKSQQPLVIWFTGLSALRANQPSPVRSSKF